MALHPVGDRKQYLQVRLQDSGASIRPYVHRLVCIAFHGPCPPGHECDHRNEDTTDNRADNLRWLPRTQNLRRQARNTNYNSEGLAHE